MPPRTVLLKPASGECNLRCKYCFYHDEMHNRNCQSYGRMSLEVLECIISKTLAASDKQCTFCFQGGEPILAGLDFFRSAMDMQKKYARRDVAIFNSLQTNGTLITEEWAKFLKKNKFLVGVSLDGPQSLHDLYRRDALGNGTFQRVMESIKLLRTYQVPVNVLTVITAQTTRHTRDMLNFFQHIGVTYQQHIPCLNPIVDTEGSQPYSLTAEKYCRFLVSTFNYWYNERSHARFVFNRYFDNLLEMFLGRSPEACDMLGYCSVQYAVEADGSVYPCDFYMLDNWKIGNILQNDLLEIDLMRDKLGFIEQSKQKAPDCFKCHWFVLCRGGCRRNRPMLANGTLQKSIYCEAYKEFFAYAAPKLRLLANNILNGKMAMNGKK